MENEIESPIVLDEEEPEKDQPKNVIDEKEEELFIIYEKFEDLTNQIIKTEFDKDRIPPIFEPKFQKNEKFPDQNRLFFFIYF